MFKHFLANITEKCEGSTLLREGDILGNLTNRCHKFGSSKLNLTYEGLLLEARRRPQGSSPKRLNPR
jgi:hypothetical protein